MKFLSNILLIILLIMLCGCSVTTHTISLYDNGNLLNKWENCTINYHAKTTDNFLKFYTENGEGKIISGGTIIIDVYKKELSNNSDVTNKFQEYNKNNPRKDSLYVQYVEIRNILHKNSLKIKGIKNKNEKKGIRHENKLLSKKLEEIEDLFWIKYNTSPFFLLFN